MRFAQYFPLDCPPEDASAPSSQTVLRLVSDVTPSPQDFEPHCKIKPDLAFPNFCQHGCGLSVFLELGDVQNLQARIPGLRKKKIAYGTLAAHWGFLKHTPNNNDSHHTWWKPEDVMPWLDFKVR